MIEAGKRLTYADDFGNAVGHVCPCLCADVAELDLESRR